MSDNFEVDKSVSPCAGCCWKYSDKCKRCKHRYVKHTPMRIRSNKMVLPYTDLIELSYNSNRVFS